MGAALGKWEVWLIILVIVLVLFGGSRLAGIGKSLGQGIRGFKDEMNDGMSDKKDAGTVVNNTTPVVAYKSENGSSEIGPDEEVVVTIRERKREDGSIERVEERSIRKKAQA